MRNYPRYNHRSIGYKPERALNVIYSSEYYFRFRKVLRKYENSRNLIPTSVVTIGICIAVSDLKSKLMRK